MLKKYIHYLINALSDANVPPMVTEDLLPTPCCYKLSLEPLPGHGFPLKVAAGFCHEPDHVQLHLNESSAIDTPTSGMPPSISGAGAAGSTSLSQAKGSQHSLSTSLPATFHASSCDTILWPSTSLNVTSNSGFNNDTVTKKHSPPRIRDQSIAPNVTSARQGTDQDSDLIVALARWLGMESEESRNNNAKLSRYPSIHGGYLVTLVLLIHPLMLQWLRWLKAKRWTGKLHITLLHCLGKITPKFSDIWVQIGNI